MTFRYLLKSRESKAFCSDSQKGRKTAKLPFAAPLLFLLFSCISYAAEFCIEDATLKPVPREAAKAILAWEKEQEFKKCGFEGKTMSLSLPGMGTFRALVVTTSGGCCCGNALCPIWVLQPRGSSYSILLSDGGYCMKIGKQKQGKAPDIRFQASTAGWSQESIWKFDGKRYIRVRFITK
jgi:hypothetical protein